MTAPIVKGSDVATLVEESEGWQRGRGYFSRKVFEGSEAAILAKKSELYTGSGGTLESFDRAKAGRGKWRLDVYLAGALSGLNADDDAEAQTNAEWELDGDELDKDLRTKFTSISASRYETLDAAIDNGTAQSLTSLTEDEQNYVDLRLLGVESYRLFQYRLRRRWIVNGRSSLRPAFDHVGQVDTPPTPTGLLDNLPDLEWLKCAPDVQVIGKLKWQVVQEWLGADAWSAVLYGGSADP